MSFLSDTTTKKSEYIKQWGDHVNQLERIGWPLIEASEGNEFYTELQEIKHRLNQLIKIAADEDFD